MTEAKFGKIWHKKDEYIIDLITRFATPLFYGVSIVTHHICVGSGKIIKDKCDGVAVS